ncbi:hypothetical protein [Pontibacter sp. G13]|uniref:hypothetical protein n=1 Tax=Pontibacter sp. G13 TaxID=3074898 RepID=UPI002889E87C|nr:hypothetical protein [Pontibacter sp. G13]WNJ18415.1 hypothetical protein RJD25_26470 [Pontibacter sp. G13]
MKYLTTACALSLALLLGGCGEPEPIEPDPVEEPIEEPCTNPAEFIFEEENGLVVIEAEQNSIPLGWKLQTSIEGHTGEGYITWIGGDKFGEPGSGLLRYKIDLKQTGRYRFMWRSRITHGNNNTEANDAWLKMSRSADFYGEKNGARVYPKGSGKTPNPNGAGKEGWFKIYMNQLNQWGWQTTTSDHDPHQIYTQIDTPGIYFIEVSGRSNHFAIDRMVLTHEDNAPSEAQEATLPESSYYCR